MIVIAFVSFYTTRITLQLLGVEDFGIKNVISGIIGFMSIVTTAMVNASLRFLSYDLGKTDINQFCSTYSMLINMFLIFSALGVVALEAVGPVLINNYLVIPEGRLIAAHWIFQFSVLSFVISTMSVPFTSAVIASEKMDVFAYVSLLDAGLKLAVVFLLYVVPFDKLVAVVLFTVLAHFVTNSIYYIYCKTRIKGCRYIKCWDKGLLKKLSSFMGWNLFGSTTSVLTVQGLSILLNMFFGPIINAAKGIADTINSFVSQVVSNFFLAVSPQIVKTYANDEKDYSLRLVIYSSKFAIYLIALLGIPLINNMEPLLDIWLGEERVTSEMILFSQWTIIYVMSQTYEYPITQTVRATGDIKNYQIINGLILLSFIPLCYCAFTMGMPAISSIIILVALTIVALQYRIIKLTRILDISVWTYYYKVVIPSLIAILPTAIIIRFINIDNSSLLKLIFSVTVSFLITFIFVTTIGMSRKEREFALSFIKKRK